MNTILHTPNLVPETARLEVLLSRRIGSRIRELRIDIETTGLILHGWTDSYYSKQIAQHAAMDLTGMPILANDIEVKSHDPRWD